MKLNLLPVRIIQGLFSVLVIALSGYVAHWYNVDTLTASPSQINFLMFAGIWSLISIIFLEGVVRFFPKANHPFVAIGIEASNVLFFFSGFIALAVFLSKLLFCRGGVCAAARADVAFAATLFVGWAASFVIVGLMTLRSGGFRKASSAPSAATMAMPPAGAGAPFSGPAGGDVMSEKETMA